MVHCLLPLESSETACRGHPALASPELAMGLASVKETDLLSSDAALQRVHACVSSPHQACTTRPESDCDLVGGQ